LQAALRNRRRVIARIENESSCLLQSKVFTHFRKLIEYLLPCGCLVTGKELSPDPVPISSTIGVKPSRIDSMNRFITLDVGSDGALTLTRLKRGIAGDSQGSGAERRHTSTQRLRQSTPGGRGSVRAAAGLTTK
jgi:hypothetical protein